MRATWMPTDEPCTLEQLRTEGIDHELFDVREGQAAIQRIKTRRKLSKDENVHITTDNPKHEAAIAKEQDEHAHMGDEVRMILDGDIVYEVRAQDDRWIRLAATAGELIVIPEKRYHRFCVAGASVTYQELYEDRGALMPFYRVSNDETRAV